MATSNESTRGSNSRVKHIADTIVAIRMLDLATQRFRTTLAAEWGVTVTDSLAMSNLALAGGSLTPRALADRLLVSAGTLTTMIDRLENRGYVSREPNPDDRRSLLVVLTDVGRETLFYSSSMFTELLDQALPPDHGDEAITTLRTLARAMDAMTAKVAVDRSNQQTIK